MKKLVLVIMILFLISGCFGLSNRNIEQPLEPKPQELKEEEKIVEITIAGVGDIMVHSRQYEAAYDSQTKEYNFKNNFTLVRDYIKLADIAIANLETTFGGEERGYSGYPRFNTPDTMADALKYAGFDVISTINNHTMDTGIKGMFRTLEILKDRGLIPIGTRESIEDKSYIIKEVQGINVGITAYSYETPSTNGMKTLNGIPIPKEYTELFDTFNYQQLEKDLGKIQRRIEKMREEGAEIIVFVVHWGSEYQRSYDKFQKEMAGRLNSFGVDIIFGSHPHVIQPIETIEREDGHKTVIAYSLGNFISNQRYEFLNNRYTEDGIVVYVTYQKNLKTGETTLKETAYLPTWVNRYRVKEMWIYEVIPVFQALQNKEAYNLTNADSIERAKISLNNTVNWIKEFNENIRQITE
ncbi:CapA family protein [Anaerobranca gottschalkii]|uniref:Poly-gamma-glutamate synthesis protein (Capsule biosynthesis protein) n=1 Tax=Anaerobranca gottschalkii DSM 13577 TaxID=1120990 RepID=A0A1I0CW92_9FIRM|nr:CapA family protein [Anaerobranca gottschalkii]SET23579.1 poly-gamma-glutamate synthesis protein (capsule biosynthesis protein) [Anaerobranca gottschalkii DSM 13577]